MGKLVLFAVLAGACADDLDPYGRVLGFRILALRAEPPELHVGQETVVDAFVVGVDPATVEYRWSWCPFLGEPASGFACAVDEIALQAALPPGVRLPTFDRGSGATANFAYAVPTEVIVGLCSALQGLEVPDFQSRTQCDGGLDIYMRLDATANGQTISALKEVRLSTDPSRPPNQNPRTLEIALRNGGPEDLVRSDLLRNEQIELRAALDPEDAENYLGVPVGDPGGEIRPLRERLIVSWFSTAGSFDPERDAFLDGERSLEEASRTRWTTPLPADAPSAQVDLFVVLRDDRGGATWQRSQTSLSAEVSR